MRRLVILAAVVAAAIAVACNTDIGRRAKWLLVECDWKYVAGGEHQSDPPTGVLGGVEGEP